MSLVFERPNLAGEVIDINKRKVKHELQITAANMIVYRKRNIENEEIAVH